MPDAPYTNDLGETHYPSESSGGGGGGYTNDLGESYAPGQAPAPTTPPDEIYSPVNIRERRHGALMDASHQYLQAGQGALRDRLYGRVSLAQQQQLQGLADARRQAAIARSMGGLQGRAGMWAATGQAGQAIGAAGMARAAEIAEGRRMADEAAAAGTKYEMMAQDMRNRQLMAYMQQEQQRRSARTGMDEALAASEQRRDEAMYSGISTGIEQGSQVGKHYYDNYSQPEPPPG